MAEKIRVGILFGGKSAEHEVSLQSAKNVIEALDKEKYQPVLIGIDKSGTWYLNEEGSYLLNSHDPKLIKLNSASDPIALLPEQQGKLINLKTNDTSKTLDVVFPLLHGPFGEDGTIQGLLKLANIPFVGAGILGSAIGMDKDVMKRLLRDAGLPLVDFIVINKGRDELPGYDWVVEKLGSPVYIKPANLGSSVGISRVRAEAEYLPAVEEAFNYDNKILIEESINGREIECAVLGNNNPLASVPGEIVPNSGFYSYDAKYIDGEGAKLKIPAKLSAQQVADIQELAIKTFQTLCCDGLARVDFFLQADGKIIVNELNTMPGFTSISMYPRLWATNGLTYTQLIDRLIELAFEKFAQQQKLATERT